MPVVGGVVSSNKALVRAKVRPAGRSARGALAGDPLGEEVTAQLDTGATVSAVSSELAERIGAFPIDKELILTAGGERYSRLYEVDIRVLLGVEIMAFRRVLVPEFFESRNIESQKVSLLIGMDIIRAGSLHVAANSFTFAL